jgi:rod shape-determining protein MreD
VRASRVVLAVALVATALVLQVSVLPRLPLPGATPDLVLLCVVGLALAGGPLTGAVVGFGSGLALDLAPPADHAIGRWALVLCLVGYAAGLAEDESDRSAFAPLLVVAAAAAGAAVLFAGLGALLGDPRVGWGPLLEVLPTAVLYDVALAPFVVSGVIALSRRVAPEPTYS